MQAFFSSTYTSAGYLDSLITLIQLLVIISYAHPSQSGSKVIVKLLVKKGNLVLMQIRKKNYSRSNFSSKFGLAV